MAFAYTEATNIVVATAGTSGTPLTFADFVTADRAGTGTDLLLATAGLVNNTLTYPVRPVEELAVLVKCVVAAKTAEADFIFITGTDWRGAAQTESIDVTAGNGSYTSTKYWATISNLDCSDNAAGGGTVWADGTIQVTQDVWGVIWDYGLGQYRIDSYFQVGNGSTSTYFQSKIELVAFSSSLYFTVTSAATLEMGDLSGAYGIDGSAWSLATINRPDIIAAGSTTANFWVYASYLFNRSAADMDFEDGNIDLRNSIYRSSAQLFRMRQGLQSVYLDQVYFSNCGFTLYVNATKANQIQTHLGSGTAGVNFGINSATMENINVSAYPTYDVANWSAITGTMKNPVNLIVAPYITQPAGVIIEQFTCNIHVADKDGANLAGVVIDCEDQLAAAVWGAGTVSTDAAGVIVEQTITYKTWTGTSETLVTSSPHKFTLSKAGYETLVLDAVTVDGPIDWHFELQQQKQSPAPWQEGAM